jgi:hypothetical protein
MVSSAPVAPTRREVRERLFLERLLNMVSTTASRVAQNAEMGRSRIKNEILQSNAHRSWSLHCPRTFRVIVIAPLEQIHFCTRAMEARLSGWMLASNRRQAFKGVLQHEKHPRASTLAAYGEGVISEMRFEILRIMS